MFIIFTVNNDFFSRGLSIKIEFEIKSDRRLNLRVFNMGEGE